MDWTMSSESNRWTRCGWGVEGVLKLTIDQKNKGQAKKDMMVRKGGDEWMGMYQNS